jgi:hypothetical protein
MGMKTVRIEVMSLNILINVQRVGIVSLGVKMVGVFRNIGFVTVGNNYFN